ncbi:unnamed protein product, partial [Bubo scandiacus]
FMMQVCFKEWCKGFGLLELRMLLKPLKLRFARDTLGAKLKSLSKQINKSRDSAIMELLGFCFPLTDGQGALKLNSALIALCHLKFYLLHRFCLQVSGFQTFGNFFSPG